MSGLLTENLPLLAGAPNGIPKLRELILELAVRGRLLSQDSGDEPAHVLVDEIRRRSRELIRAGELKKDACGADVQPGEAPFVLPAGWGWGRIADSGQYINGLAFKPQDWGTEGKPIIRIQNLSGRNLQFNRTNRLVGDQYVVRPGDILVSWSATLDAYYWDSQEEGVLNQHIFRVIPSDLMIPPYLYWVLKASIGEMEAGDHAHGLVMTHINRGPFLAHVIGVPPKPEQRRIVEKIDELMTLCDRLEKQQADAASAHGQLIEALLGSLTDASDADDFAASWQRLSEPFDTLFNTKASIDALKQALLQLAVMGKLVPQDPREEPVHELLERIESVKERLVEEGLRTTASTDLTESDRYLLVPEGWTYCRLGNLARFIDYRGRTPIKVAAGTPLITAKNVRFGFVSREPREFIAESDYAAWMTRGIPRVGDMLFTTEAPLGNIALVEIQERFALAQRVICFQLHEPRMGPFLRIAMMSRPLQAQFGDAATGMTATGIKASRLKEVPLPIPPQAEQERIVAKVNQLMTLCDGLKSRLVKARQLTEQLASALVERAVA